jgi:hypothetical protein
MSTNASVHINRTGYPAMRKIFTYVTGEKYRSTPHPLTRASTYVSKDKTVSTP